MDEVQHDHLISLHPFSGRTAVPGSNPTRGYTHRPAPYALAETVLLLKAVGTYEVHPSK